jgi:hypothetical protein
MIILLAITFQWSETRSDPNDGRPPSLRQRLWRRFLDWLMEPIPFPGMTLDIKPARKRWSDEKAKHRADKSPSEQGERPSIEPDELLARAHGWRVTRGQPLPTLPDRSKPSLVKHPS